MMPIGRINLFVGFVSGVDTGDSKGHVDSTDSHVQYFELGSPAPI